MTGHHSPSFAQLLDWIEGQLEPAEAEVVAQAVASGDDEVTATVAWIRSFLATAERQPLQAPPPDVRQRLRWSFERHHGLRPEGLLLADLSYDSRTDDALVGVRGDQGHPGQSYQLAYAAGSADVLVDVIRSGDHASFEGQVLMAGTHATTWSATAETADGSGPAVAGDDYGCFAVTDVPLASTSLRLTNGEVEIQVPLPHDWTQP